MEVKLLYVDENIVVCLKPAGVLSQAGREGQESMLSLLHGQLGGDFYPVHRLDREVGGIMVFARNAKAAGNLSKQIQEGIMKKEYLAVVHGCPQEHGGFFEDLLLHDMKKNKTYVVDRMRKGVKKARLSYQVLGKGEDRALVQVRLFTGRSHQIRVQFASRQMPLWGDGRYGGGNGKIALYSVRLSFRDPESGRKVSYAFLPEIPAWTEEIPDLAEME